MTTIWGIAAPFLGQSLRYVFDKMSMAMPFNSNDQVSRYINDHVALGHSTIGSFHNNGFPVRFENCQYVSLCGVPIWESENEPLLKDRDESGKMINDSIMDASCIQFARKENRLEELGGSYSFSVWDVGSKTLSLGTDRLGFRSLYYLHDEAKNIVYFASRLCGLVDTIDRDLEHNWRAILEFMHFGHPLGDKTFYSEINLVPPATIIHFSNKGFKKESYWDINSVRIDHNMSYQDAIESQHESFSNSVKRRIQRINEQKTIVLLSGGADSRRIAGEMSAQNVLFETFTTRGYSSVDSESAIASEVANTLHVKNTFIDLPMPGFIREYWSKANRLLDYECCLHQWLLPLVEQLPRLPMINYDGIGGDIPLEGVFKNSGFADIQKYNQVNSLNDVNKAKQIIGRFNNYSFFKYKIRDMLANVSLQLSVKEELGKYSNSENQLMLFFLMNRTRRSIALSPTRILQSKLENFFPFVDLDVLKSSMQIPLKYRLLHTLRKDILEFSFPDLARIPYTQYKKQVKGYDKYYIKSYHKEKLYQLRSNIYSHFIKNNKIFETREVALKFMACLVLSYCNILRIPYEFSLTYQIFNEWFDDYGSVEGHKRK